MTEKRKKRGLREAGIAYLLLLIPLGWWLVVGLFPVVWGIGLAFCDWSSLAAAPVFHGLTNFGNFFTQRVYLMSLLRSFLLGGGAFVLTNLLGFGAALLLNRVGKLKTLFRAVWYVPAVTSTVATTQIFNILLDPFDGVINNTISALGGNPVVWMDSTLWAVVWILIYSIWKGLGGSILLWLAGLQSLDEKLNEAAALDGAGALATFWYVKVPQLKSIAVFIFVTGFTGAMQIYEQVYFISGGGPYMTTEVLAFKIMDDAFWNGNIGMACTSSVVMLLATFAVSLTGFRAMTRRMEM